MIRKPRVVLDTNVLFHPGLRDFLLNIAIKKLYQPVWTAFIMHELYMSLRKTRSKLSRSKILRTIRAIEAFFWWANVRLLDEDFKGLTLPDNDDVHVLAAAIKSRSSIIVTLNLRDFPKRILSKYVVEAQHLDVFCASLVRSHPGLVHEVFRKQVADLRRPSLSEDEVLRSWEKIGLRRTVELLRK